MAELRSHALQLSHRCLVFFTSSISLRDRTPGSPSTPLCSAAPSPDNHPPASTSIPSGPVPPLPLSLDGTTAKPPPILSIKGKYRQRCNQRGRTSSRQTHSL